MVINKDMEKEEIRNSYANYAKLYEILDDVSEDIRKNKHSRNIQAGIRARKVMQELIQTAKELRSDISTQNKVLRMENKNK